MEKTSIVYCKSLEHGSDLRCCYAVSTGSYSDYQVYAVFSIRGGAEAFLAGFDWAFYDDVRIEEILFDPTPARYVNHQTLYGVTMTAAGEAVTITPVTPPPFFLRPARCSGYFREAPHVNYVWAETPQEAVAAVDERRRIHRPCVPGGGSAPGC